MMTVDRDVTDQVDFGDVDGECLPLTRCVCGTKFPLWDHILGIYDDHPAVCPSCGALLYFRCSIRVFERKSEAAR